MFVCFALHRRVVCAICILHHTNTVLLSFSPQVHEGRDGSKWDDGVDAGRGDGGHGGDGLLIRASCQVRERAPSSYCITNKNETLKPE